MYNRLIVIIWNMKIEKMKSISAINDLNFSSLFLSSLSISMLKDCSSIIAGLSVIGCISVDSLQL